MVEITERREVRVRADAGTFVFAAEPEAGRLVIREQRDDGDQEELCALTIADREELSGFLQGLRRVLGVEEERTAHGETVRAEPSQRAAGRAGGGQETSQRGSRAALAASSAQGTSTAGAARDGDDGEDDRREAMERARARGQSKAFAPWSRAEEQQLLDAVEAGRDLDELAREHQRSRRALELRLERLRQ